MTRTLRVHCSNRSGPSKHECSSRNRKYKSDGIVMKANLKGFTIPLPG